MVARSGLAGAGDWSCRFGVIAARHWRLWQPKLRSGVRHYSVRLGLRCVPLAAAAIYLVVYNGSRTAYVALLVAAAPFWWACYRGARYNNTFAAISFFLVSAPLIYLWHANQQFRLSAASRAELWINTVASWMSVPIFGHGIGGFDAAYGAVRSTHQKWFPSLDTILTVPTVFAGATHNEYLQALQQFGLYGVVLIGGLGYAVMRCRGPWAANATLLLAAGCAIVGFPAQNPATAVLIVVGLALVARSGERRPWRVPVTARAALTVLVVAAIAGLGWVGHRSYMAARHMAQFALTVGPDPLKAFELNLTAHEVFPLSADIRRQVSPSLARVMQVYKSNLQLDEKAADRVFSIALSAGPHDVAALTMRAEYLINAGRATEPQMTELVRRLMLAAENIPTSWLIKAHWHQARGETELAVRAARHGLNVGLRNPILDAQMRAIATETTQ